MEIYDTTIQPQAGIRGGWENAYATCDKASLWREEEIACMPSLLELILAKQLKTVLDLGCGDGRNLIALLNAGLTCFGMDLSETALTRAQQKIAALGHDVQLHQGDIADLPFSNNSIDVVTCFDVFGQLPKPEQVIAEVRRVLVPGGLLALNAFTTGDSEFGVGEQIGERSFYYKDTLFRYFEADEISAMLADWTVLRFDMAAWIDPPHGDFRPYSHRHENFIVFASPPQ